VKNLWKLFTAIFVAVFSLGTLTACAASEPVDPASYAAIIDVRTVDEWNTGHLETAVLMDISDAAFASNLETLDKSANYYVYCRSGNRAGQAIEQMKQLGFTGTLTNGGSVEDASAATGLAIVQ
jgi:rhodanese-related sulfurtransferase